MSSLRATLALAAVLGACESSQQSTGGEDDGGNSEPPIGDGGSEPAPDGDGGPPDGPIDPLPDGGPGVVPSEDGGPGVPPTMYPPFPVDAPVSSTCTATIRYAPTSDRIYLDGEGVVCSPRDIALKLAELQSPVPAGHGILTVDAEQGIYYLASNLFLQNGATLSVRGTAIGGDTNELRLKSSNSSDPSAYVFIRAHHGNILFEGTHVFSWDDVANGPDTEYDALGRAFIHVRSWLDPDGVTPHESRMDILDSEVSYLGHYASEAYGLVWKVAGEHTTATGQSLFDLVNVYGDIKNSSIHHNYFGVYTYGLYGGVWDNNEVHHNVKYGIDPHDDSDSIEITNNHVYDNGNHGIICSRRCDGITVTGNISERNVGVGIFLHGFMTDSLVENNQALDNTDTGIALFDSHRNTIRHNVSLRNANGLRLSVGASNNVFEDNDIGFSTKYGIYFYQGTDLPVEGDGHPKLNKFLRNNIHDGAQAIKLSDADDNLFEGNDFANFANRTVHFKQGLRNVMEANNFAPDQGPVVKVEGIPTNPSLVSISERSPFSLVIVGQGTGIIQNADGQIYATRFSPSTLVDDDGSSLTVSNNMGAELRGDVTPLGLFIDAAGAASASVVPGEWAQTRNWSMTASSVSDRFTYYVSELVSGSCYGVAKQGAPLATLAADQSGLITFTDQPGAGAVAYSVSDAACP